MTLPERKPPRPLRALLIDLDGTVCDTHGLIQECYDHAIRTHLGQPGRRELWEQNVGLPLEAILETTYAFYATPLSQEHLAEVKKTYRSHMRARAESVRAFPGIPEVLQFFRAQGVRLAVVTTKHRGMALRHLQTSGVQHLFDAIIPGDECERCKPDPEPFLRALRALDIEAESAVGVGDSQHDITAARAAGLYTVAALWGAGNRAALLATRPDNVAFRPIDLPASCGLTDITREHLDA